MVGNAGHLAEAANRRITLENGTTTARADLDTVT
jgi:hypothetical protein